YCDAGLADSTFGQPMVAVVDHERRQVKGDREAGLALLQQIMEPPVGVLRSREAGELAHAPDFSPVHRRVDAAREGIFARVAQLAVVIKTGKIGWSVKALDGRAGYCGERYLALGGLRQRRFQGLLLPAEFRRRRLTPVA